jgi:hypothetical protein
MPRKQRSLTELFEAQRRRKSDMQTDLLRIVDGDGTLKNRKLLSNPGPWNETARGEMPYEPFEKGIVMLRDAARTASLKATKTQQEQVRANIRAFLATIERYALEELPEENEADVIPFFLDETVSQCSADPVEDLAKVEPTPQRLLAVARAMEPQIRASTRLRDACYRAAQRGLTLVRSAPLQAAR